MERPLPNCYSPGRNSGTFVIQVSLLDGSFWRHSPSSTRKQMINFRKVYIPLIIANLIPMVGVLYAKWGLTGYLFSYWLETYIISLVVVCKYFQIVEKRGKRLRTLVHLLGGVIIISALLLAILGLLLKSISWKVMPGGSIPLPDLFQLFFNYITRYNFIIFALVPIGISIAIHVAWYVRSGAHRKTGLAHQVIEDLSLRFILQGSIIVTVALLTGSRQMVVIFFILRVALEVYLHEDKLERLDERPLDSVRQVEREG